MSLRTITRTQWLTLFAAQAGYMLDAMDVLLFVFAVNVIRDEFHLSASEAGLVSSFTLAFSAVGGIVFGILSDRMGRARTLVWSIMIYSLASAGTALSWNLASLLFWRALVGIGLGAEWSAGAVLVAETWPAEHRAKAVGIMQSGWALGYMLAAAVTAVVLPRWGWKALFFTGVLPALLAVALRKNLPEPEIWRRHGGSIRVPMRGIFQGVLLRRTVLASLLATVVLFAYWGLFTWIPGFLSASPERGGAGLSIVKTSGFIIPMQAGAFLGYICFGLLRIRSAGVPRSCSMSSGPPSLLPFMEPREPKARFCCWARRSGFSAPASSACLARCCRNCIPRNCAALASASSITWDAASARSPRSPSVSQRIATASARHWA